MTQDQILDLVAYVLGGLVALAIVYGVGLWIVHREERRP